MTSLMAIVKSASEKKVTIYGSDILSLNSTMKSKMMSTNIDTREQVCYISSEPGNFRKLPRKFPPGRNTILPPKPEEMEEMKN